MSNLILYRADRKGNTTLPERFDTDGLLSKQINGGDPFFYSKYGWLKSIKSHIHHFDSTEAFLYNTTSFLSFSENENIIRKVYLKGSDSKPYTETTKELAEAYLFKIELEKKQLTQLGKGIYSFKFKCNYDKNEISPFYFSSIGCNKCSNGQGYHHEILLIDAVEVLSKLVKTNSKYKTAYDNSFRDSEWLIMSLDPMEDGIGFRSRIPVADFWSVEYFKYI